MLVKDHRFELPIKQIEWQKDSDLVLSIDKRVCKIWDRQTVRRIFYLYHKIGGFLMSYFVT